MEVCDVFGSTHSGGPSSFKGVLGARARVGCDDAADSGWTLHLSHQHARRGFDGGHARYSDVDGDLAYGPGPPLPPLAIGLSE